MPIGSFADTASVERETIVLSRALLEIEEITLTAEPHDVKSKDGEVLFSADPHMNALVKIVDDYSTGEHDGKKFWDKFYLKKNKKNKKWEVGENSKPGHLVKAHPKYGPDHFKNPKVIDEADFEGFQFEAGTEQREDRSGRKLEGTRIVWNSIGPVPDRTKKKKTTTKDTTEDTPDQVAGETEVLNETEEATMKAALG